MRTRAEKMLDAKKRAIHEAPTRVGQKLGNGGVILQIQEVRDEDRVREYVVLAIVEGQYQPFVTWSYGVGITDAATGGFVKTSPYCWAGNYFTKDLLREALDDFERRAGLTTPSDPRLASLDRLEEAGWAIADDGDPYRPSEVA